jgi:hypothetical protein
MGKLCDRVLPLYECSTPAIVPDLSLKGNLIVAKAASLQSAKFAVLCPAGLMHYK